MVVELNSRPGLGIQMANQAGLKERLVRLRKMKNVSEDRAVRLAKDLFGGEIEEEIEKRRALEIEVLKHRKTLTGISVTQDEDDELPAHRHCYSPWSAWQSHQSPQNA